MTRTVEQARARKLRRRANRAGKRPGFQPVAPAPTHEALLRQRLAEARGVLGRAVTSVTAASAHVSRLERALLRAKGQ